MQAFEQIFETTAPATDAPAPLADMNLEQSRRDSLETAWEPLRRSAAEIEAERFGYLEIPTYLRRGVTLSL